MAPVRPEGSSTWSKQGGVGPTAAPLSPGAEEACRAGFNSLKEEMEQEGGNSSSRLPPGDCRA